MREEWMRQFGNDDERRAKEQALSEHKTSLLIDSACADQPHYVRPV